MQKKLKKQSSSSPIHILIDGPDGTGKSTICKMLSKQLNIPIIKMQGMPRYFHKNPEEASEVYNRTIIQFKDSSFIMDRGWPTSYVYTHVYKRHPVGIDYIKKDIARKLDEKLVILVSDKPFRFDDLVDSDTWLKLNFEYEIFFTSYAMKGDLLINTSKFTPKQICDKILETL